MYQCIHQSCRRVSTNLSAYEVRPIRRLSGGFYAGSPWCDIQVFHVRFHASVKKAMHWSRLRHALKNWKEHPRILTREAIFLESTASAAHLGQAVKTELRELLDLFSLTLDAALAVS
jgi:hypothetical protein